jgi:hypothetical protein
MNTHDPSARNDEPARDAWLSEALRHAPDANAAPPPALSEAILRQARAATRAPAATPRGNRLMAAWSWLARPPIAAGFASVMVATLLGLMWWDRPLDQTLQRPPAPSAARVDAPAAPTAQVDERARAPASTAAPPQPPPQPPRTPKAARTAPIPAPAPQQGAAPAAADSARDEAPRASRAAAPATAPSRDEAEANALAGAAAPKAERSSPAFAPAPEPAAAAQSLRSTPNPREAAASAAASFDALVAAIGQEPDRWTWQRGTNALPLTESLKEWLRQAAAATAGRWRATPDAPPAGRSLRLLRDGTLAATLALDDASLRFAPASAGASSATLTPDAASTLRRALDLAAP